MQHQIKGYARVDEYEDRSCMTAIGACWCETLRKERDWRTRLSLLRDRRVEGCFYTETPQINYLIEDRLGECCVHSSYV